MIKVKKSFLISLVVFSITASCYQTEKKLSEMSDKNQVKTEEAKIDQDSAINKDKEVSAVAPAIIKDEMVANERAYPKMTVINGSSVKKNIGKIKGGSVPTPNRPDYIREPKPTKPDNFNTEEYNVINENPFMEVTKSPLSTFSIDVDTASYTNIRRFITEKNLPPKDAVRIEEMLNYFSYDYPQPKNNEPFSINIELGQCPWEKGNKLVQVGLQGKKIETENLPPSNIVFLIDTSGSMSDPNKLPLLKQAFKLLVKQMREKDTISIVTYAGSAGLVLPATSGDKKEEIMDALDKLESGGSTAGGEGIQLAYKTAQENFNEKGNNRVILATDGDFNIGASSEGELVRMIEEKREKGVFLSVLGFGMGNYKDSKMEQLADKGNGNYAYIDNLNEAKKVFVKQMGGTLFTIAKDVKLQVEFNPSKIKAYRLIGYENRALNNQDFNDDKKDAGELGSGHSVTALYEVVPIDAKVSLPQIDELKYQENKVKETAHKTDELLTVKFRYKEPKENKSKLLVKELKDRDVVFDKTSENFRFASAVAGFGLIIRDSEYKGSINVDKVIEIAKKSLGTDEQGYRDEFVDLVKAYKKLSKVDNLE